MLEPDMEDGSPVGFFIMVLVIVCFGLYICSGFTNGLGAKTPDIEIVRSNK